MGLTRVRVRHVGAAVGASDWRGEGGGGGRGREGEGVGAGEAGEGTGAVAPVGEQHRGHAQGHAVTPTQERGRGEREGRCGYDVSVWKGKGSGEVYLVSCRRKGRRRWGRASRDRLRACHRFDSHTA